MTSIGATHDLAAANPTGQRVRLGADVIAAARAYSLWTMLGWNDIRQRYRRSVLGPFWITLSMGLFILVLGVIYSKIFKIELKSYMPFLALGYILWGFISQTVVESCNAFQEGERIIKQIRLPYAMYVLRVVWRNFLVLLHTIIIFVPMAIIFSVRPGSEALLFIPGFILLYLNLVWVALVLAILCARYRDLQQIVTTGTQIMLFATPIMWPIQTLGEHQFIAELNPLYHVLSIVRSPLLGIAPEARSWTVSIGIAIVGWTLALLLHRRALNRIVFWL